MERGGTAAVPFEDPLWNFKRGGGAGGVRPLWPSLKTLFGISKGGAPPPESASDVGVRVSAARPDMLAAALTHCRRTAD